MTSILNRNRVLGIAVVGAVAVTLGAIPSINRRLNPPAPTPTAMPIYQEVYVFGGYRFDDEEILAYLRDEYGLDVTFVRKGTFAMADEWTPEVDCVFPSSRTGIEYFEQTRPDVIRRAETIFQDPVVVFTWEEYLPTLEDAGIVVTEEDVHILQMDPLLDAMLSDQKWEDIGVDIPGYVNVESTDPLNSASGLMWFSLVAGYLVPGNETGGRVVTFQDLDEGSILPLLYQYWENQGMQVDTTGKLFPRFVLTHAPMIVAYESNYTDYYQSLPPNEQLLAEEIVGVYPQVTINTEHMLASTSPDCDRLLEVFVGDTTLHEMAWRLAGVRNRAGGIGQHPGNASWIADNVPYVPEPKLNVTDAIKAELGK